MYMILNALRKTTWWWDEWGSYPKQYYWVYYRNNLSLTASRKWAINVLLKPFLGKSCLHAIFPSTFFGLDGLFCLESPPCDYLDLITLHGASWENPTYYFVFYLPTCWLMRFRPLPKEDNEHNQYQHSTHERNEFMRRLKCELYILLFRTE